MNKYIYIYIYAMAAHRRTNAPSACKQTYKAYICTYTCAKSFAEGERERERGRLTIYIYIHIYT